MQLKRLKITLLSGILMLIVSAFVYPVISVNTNSVVNTNTCDTISWMDSTGNTRTGSIVKINGNPSGYNGGYFSRITYMDGGNLVNCNESGSAGDLSGLGFMVDHVPSGAQLPAGYTGRGWINSKQDGTGGKTSIVFQGANHIIYETEMNEYGDDSQHARGTWKVKWRYMIRTGCDYIVDSISYDFSSQAAGNWGNDIRSPYCEFNWTGTGASNTLTEPIDGVEFCATDTTGASWIFKTVGSSPFTGGYTYNMPGKNIPYTRQWLNSPDREIGYISTLDLTQWAAGGGFLSGPVNIGSTGSSMPPSWAINYQSNGFQNWMGDKMTWQLPYGAAGGETAAESGTAAHATFPDWTWRKNWNGYPVVGFTLLIQIDKNSSDNVHRLVNEEADIHGLPQNSLTAVNGTVVTTGQASLYDANTFTLKPAGYNHIYDAWEVQCNSNQADITLALGTVSLKNQTFIFDNYTAPTVPAVTINGVSLNDGTDMFTSVDTVNKQLYITFNSIFTGSVHITAGGAVNTPTYTDTVPPGSTNTYTPTFTPSPTPQPAGCLFDNMEDMDNMNNYGGFWYSYSGGTPATVWPASGNTLTPSAGGANGTNYAMRVTGTVGVAGTTYPCVGMGSQFTATSGTPNFTELNISSCLGIRFYTKGNGSSYLVKIPYTDTTGVSLTGYNDYNYIFTAPSTWTQVSVPFTSLSQATGWGTTAALTDVLIHAKEIQWQSNFNAVAPATSVPVDLWVDEIVIYGCASCPAVAASTPTVSSTATFTPTSGSTGTFTPTITQTITSTNTSTITITSTSTSTSTSTLTFTITETFTATQTYTFTATFTPSQTPTNIANPNITSSIMEPLSAVVGQNITITMSVYNNGSVDTSGITSSALIPSIAGITTLVQGPSPASADIPIGKAVTFTWIYSTSGTSSGLSFSGNASGTYGAGLLISSSVTSGNSTVLLAPTNTATPVPPTYTDTNTSTPVNTNTFTLTFTPTWTFSETPTQTPVLPVETFTPTISNSFEIVTSTPVIIYPNPNPIPGEALDRTVKFTISQPASKIEFRMYTCMSRLIRQKELYGPFTQGEQNIKIDGSYFSGLVRGTYYYILIATNSAGSVTKRSPIEKAIIW